MTHIWDRLGTLDGQCWSLKFPGLVIRLSEYGGRTIRLLRFIVAFQPWAIVSRHSNDGVHGIRCRHRWEVF